MSDVNPPTKLGDHRVLIVNDDGIEARSRGIDGGRITGATGTNDDNFVHGLIPEPIKCLIAHNGPSACALSNP